MPKERKVSRVRILSVRRGFTADHSSTSYEFLAVDRRLGPEARKAVAALSSRARPTARTVSFVYHVDGYDIPGGWESLMREYYDVMYSESYGWWTLALAFNAPPQQQEELSRYEFDGVDDLGIWVSTSGERVIVTINCRLEWEPDAFSEWEDDTEEQTKDYEPDDDLLALLTRIRRQLIEGDYRALYAVWEKYGIDDLDDEEEEGIEVPPSPPERESGRNEIEAFRRMLEVP